MSFVSYDKHICPVCGRATQYKTFSSDFSYLNKYLCEDSYSGIYHIYRYASDNSIRIDLSGYIIIIEAFRKNCPDKRNILMDSHSYKMILDFSNWDYLPDFEFIKEYIKNLEIMK